MIASCAMSARGEWALLLPGQDLQLLPSTAAMVERMEGAGKVRAICRQRQALERLAVWTTRETIVRGMPLPSVGLRPKSNFRGHSLEVGHVGRGGNLRGWSVSSGAAMLDDDDADEIAPCPQSPESRDELRAAGAATHAVVSAWHEHVSACGLTPRMSAGATAAQLLPPTWRRAARALGQSPQWHELRGSYYGGRVECRRPGWSGEAVEYDIRSAYGASIAGKWGFIPDWKLYQREPRAREPGWFDATVSATPGAPLPMRRQDARGRAAGLMWVEDGATWRGWFTRADLELPGVEIVCIHRALAGRYSDDLQRGAEHLLQLRDDSKDQTRRAVIRLLLVALAGKLAQRRVDWRVWVPALGQEPPESAVIIGDPKNGIMVYAASNDTPSPHYLPHVAAYVTAYPRGELYRELQRAGSRAIYCDTDSIHVEAGTPPPLDLGSGFGQWAEKASGDAHYESARHYRIGAKIVQLDGPRVRT